LGGIERSFNRYFCLVCTLGSALDLAQALLGGDVHGLVGEVLDLDAVEFCVYDVTAHYHSMLHEVCGRSVRNGNKLVVASFLKFPLQADVDHKARP
jgi:hypothetical protein